MANNNFISSETLFAWGSSFNTTKKIPVIAKRVWQTYEDMFNYVSDANDTCIAGIVLTVVNDEDVTKNGAYFVVSCPTLEEPTINPVVKKIGSDEGISDDIDDIKNLLGDDSSGLVKDVADLRTTVDNLPESFVTNVKVGETSLVDGGVVDLSNFVQKEDGKGLSTNDFTDAFKNKLATIAEGAEVNYIKSVDEANLNVDASGKLTVSIPEVEVPFQSVAINDKVLTLSDGVLSSTLSYVRENYNDKDCLVLKGKNGDVLGAIEVADFVADGMLESVTPKKGSSNIFVFTFNSAAGSKSFEVDFSKYVDTYNADGVTLELGENNTFSVKEGVFVKADGYLPYTKPEQDKLATITEGAQVNTIESITLNDVTLAVDGSKNINIDLSAYATIADTSANFVQKEDGKGLSTNDFTTELKTKLDGIKEIKSVGDNLKVDASSGKLTVDLSGKLDASAEVNGVSFDNGVVTIDAGDIALESAITRGEELVYDANSSIQAVLAGLSARIDSLDPNISGEFGVSSVTAGSGIEVTGASSTPTIAVKRSAAEGNIVELKTDGVYVAAPEVPDMRSYWESI